MTADNPGLSAGLCSCGRPLHYTDPAIEARVSALVESLGPDVVVEAEGVEYRVPRHYIALHGIKAPDLPDLALDYGWARRPA